MASKCNNNVLYEKMLLMVPRIMDSKEFDYFGTKIETTAMFRPVFHRPWSRNEVIWGLRSDLDLYKFGTMYSCGKFCDMK